MRGRDKPTLSERLSFIGVHIISLFSGLLAGILLIYSGYALYDSFYVQNQAFSYATDLFKYKPVIDVGEGDIPRVSPTTIAAINEDYRGWLELDDTGIDYPVMQGKDDLYYASHDVFQDSSLTGSIYMSAYNEGDFSDNYNVIYGHHMDNGAMFGRLDDFLDEDYFNSHREGTIIVGEQPYHITVFAVLITNAYDENVYKVGHRDLDELVAFIRENSTIFDGSVLTNVTKIVAFSTCADFFTNGRLVVFALMDPTIIIPDNPETTTETEPVTETPTKTNPEDDVSDDDVPLSVLEKILALFQPIGSSYGIRAWSLYDLICTICTAYLLIPLLRLFAKFGRRSKMEEVLDEKRKMWDYPELTVSQWEEYDYVIRYILSKEDEVPQEGITAEKYEKALHDLYYNAERFRGRMRIGMFLEIVTTVAIIILLFLTQDFRLPMTLLDRWSPFFFLFLFTTWVVDVRLIRYRCKRKELDEEDEEEEQENKPEEADEQTAE